jgi:DNA-binding winged helix-turn-helix (wHTH) protein/TolB-like protein/tetratricopeptide (TPR) repeat protein
MKHTKTQTFEFGEFRLMPSEGLLLRNGEPVPLTPKVFSTLVVLVERHGHLVEKSEIIERIWNESFVEESAVSRCVWTLRRALDDKSAGESVIQTVPKRGYRFVADVRTLFNEDDRTALPVADRGVKPKAVESVSYGKGVSLFDTKQAAENEVVEVPDISDEPPVLSELPAAKRVLRTDSIKEPVLPREKRPYIVAGLLALSVFGLAAFYYLSKSQSPVIAHEVDRRLAVLPLKPVDSENRDRSLEFALAESLILKLSESKELDVKRLNTVRKYIDLEEDPVDAGRELNVDYVLSSHYQVVDGRTRVTSQLLNVETGSTEQTFRSETDSKSIFDIQDAVANEIGNAVFSKFGTPASIFAARRGTENEEAYSLYQQAWYLIDKGTAEDSAKAAKLLDRAVEIDPNYAQAWAVRSHAYCQFAHQGGGEPRAVFTTAEPMLERSMLLDPGNAMAYTIRGTINRDFHWNFPQAINDLKRAVELDPSIVLAHRILAGVYYRNGQFAEALESEKRAVDLHPTSLPDQWFLGAYLVAAGQRNEGIAQLNRVSEMNPSFSPVYQTLWEIYHIEGNHQKAYENFIKLKESYSVPLNEMEEYKRSYEKAGWPGVLRAELKWVLSKEPKGQYCNYKYYIAAFAALSGDNELAFHYIEEAIRYRLISVSFLKVDPKFAGLRSDPRFDAVINRLGLANRS